MSFYVNNFSAGRNGQILINMLNAIFLIGHVKPVFY